MYVRAALTGQVGRQVAEVQGCLYLESVFSLTVHPSLPACPPPLVSCPTTLSTLLFISIFFFFLPSRDCGMQYIYLAFLQSLSPGRLIAKSTVHIRLVNNVPGGAARFTHQMSFVQV